MLQRIPSKKPTCFLHFISAALTACITLFMLGCSEKPDSQPAAPPSPPQLHLANTFCLTTQWYPLNPQEEDETENRLLRELIRQGVLMVAREEFGLTTRDETLGESFAELNNVDSKVENPPKYDPLSIQLDVNRSGTWEATLYGAGTVEDNPVWNHQGEFKFEKRTLYTHFATAITQLNTAIAEKMRAAGATGKAVAANEDNIPGEDIEKLLKEMNFVSQYAAVRAAHQSMIEKGASFQWLGILVRGYAHLSVLTEHTWSSHSEVFAARSLLYAERMLQLFRDKHALQVAQGLCSLDSWFACYGSSGRRRNTKVVC